MSVRRKPALGDPLLPAERRVLELLAGGLTWRDIAAILHVAYDTAKDIGVRARVKLGARTSIEAVAIAVRTGVIS